MKYCPKCEIDKDENDFNKNKKSIDGLQRICKLCTKLAQKQSFALNKAKYYDRNKKQTKLKINLLNSIKAKEKCKKCGEGRYYILDHHHINPKEKINMVSYLFKSSSIKAGLEEMKKCVVLCKNCHYEFHHLERQDKITLNEYLSI